MQARIGPPEYGGAFAASPADPVRWVLPGELVASSENAGLQILQPSPERVAPRCIHFGVCGGCSYQHVTYDLQLDLKRQILTGLLARAGLADLPELQIVAGEPWGYRNRVRMRVRAALDGEFEFGYSKAATNVFLPVTMCPIAAPLLWRAVEALRRAGRTSVRAAAWLNAASEVELMTDTGQQQLQMQMFLSGANSGPREPDAFRQFCEALQADLPELRGAGALPAPDLPRRTRLSCKSEHWGSAGLQYSVDGRTYWVSRGAFFQVNRFLVDVLVGLVGEQAGTGAGVAWDLFAGVGLFTRALAERFGRVIAVEGAEPAATDLLAASSGLRGALSYEAVRMPAEDFLRAQQTQRERPEVVVLDPPRAGLGARSTALLANIAPPRIVYVSCDPVTLARDLKILCSDGYTVQTIHLVDLFPQTFHLESVVMLERLVAAERAAKPSRP